MLLHSILDTIFEPKEDHGEFLKMIANLTLYANY
jgi:hypothetical protein